VVRSVEQRIADELGVRPNQVSAAVALLDGGATVPFVARYRKEATGSLDDAQLRTLEERLRYLRELEERRAVVLESVRSQGKLDAALEGRIRAADSKARLEDVYLPYKPKRRTKAMVARENGLEPLADALLGNPTLDPTATAEAYVSENVADAAAPWTGRGRSSSSGSPRTPIWSGACVSGCGSAAGSCRPSARAGRPRGQVRRLLRLRRAVHDAAVAGSSRCSAGRRRRSSTSR
jgi:Transcriptional accessory protein